MIVDAPLLQRSVLKIDVITIPISYRNRTFFRLRNIVLLENYLKYKKFIPESAKSRVRIKKLKGRCPLAGRMQKY
jgi:hypothetical protein